MTRLDVLPAAGGDAALLSGIIAEAFRHLDVARWLVPDDHDRATVLQATMGILVEHALTHPCGLADVTVDLQSAAVWFLLDTDGGDFQPTDYDARLAAAAGPHLARFRQLDDAFAAHHPRSEPHLHLAVLATAPPHQSAGRGSTLLRHRHDRHPELPAYLEASSPQSRELYLRHGYRDHGPRIDLPDGGPPLWPMWRPATP